MRYLLEERAYSKKDVASRFNAMSKAREDITKILTSKGVEIFHINIRTIKHTLNVQYVIQGIKLLNKLKKGDELYIQHYTGIGGSKSFPAILKRTHDKGVKIIMIIHDISYLRWSDNRLAHHEINLFKNADLIVAHTPAMKQELIKMGIKCPIKILYLFDYLTNDKMIDDEKKIDLRNTVVFAGNLEKSGFIREFNEMDYKKIHFRFYGLKPSFEFKKNKIYVDKFKPENVSFIEGGWGLVWDGDSAETCSGTLGNYLRYNASHKLSLYIAAGIPLIVWEESGLAKWIVDHKLGIAIDSLADIETVLPTVTEDEYKTYLYNAKRMSQELRQGKHILSALELK